MLAIRIQNPENDTDEWTTVDSWTSALASALPLSRSLSLCLTVSFTLRFLHAIDLGLKPPLSLQLAP